MTDTYTPKLIKVFQELPTEQQRIVLQLTIAMARVQWVAQAATEANGIDRWTTNELAAELVRRRVDER